MSVRFNFYQLAPEAMKLMIEFEKYIHSTDLDPKIIELVKVRSSQINHCAHCLNMHTKDAMHIGETAQRLFLVAAWREAELFTDAERAALALTEAVTLISNNGVPDDVYNEVKKHFNEKQIVDLIIAINQINSWNRLNVTAQSPVGDYEPGKFSH